MFPVPALARVTLVATALLAGSMACGKPAEKPGDKAGEAAAPTAPTAPVAPAPAFTMAVPPKYRPVRAEPPVEAAWETPALANGFVPTIRVVKAPRAAGDFAAAYATWKAGFVEGLQETYLKPQILSERRVEGAVPGRLIIAVGQLDTSAGKKMPMPLFAFGAVYDGGDFLWVVAGMAAAKLDVATELISPIDEPEIVAAVSSFRPTAKKP
jgi:hypothetical protein